MDSCSRSQESDEFTAPRLGPLEVTKLGGRNVVKLDQTHAFKTNLVVLVSYTAPFLETLRDIYLPLTIILAPIPTIYGNEDIVQKSISHWKRGRGFCLSRLLAVKIYMRPCGSLQQTLLIKMAQSKRCGKNTYGRRIYFGDQLTKKSMGDAARITTDIQDLIIKNSEWLWLKKVLNTLSKCSRSQPKHLRMFSDFCRIFC